MQMYLRFFGIIYAVNFSHATSESIAKTINKTFFI